MTSAALEAARSSTRGSGGASSGSASPWECRVVGSREARPEESQEPRWGAAKRGLHFDSAGVLQRKVRVRRVGHVEAHLVRVRVRARASVRVTVRVTVRIRVRVTIRVRVRVGVRVGVRVSEASP